MNFLDTKYPALSAKRRLSDRQRIGGLAALLVVVIAIFLAPITTLIALNAAFVLHCVTVLILRVAMLYLSVTRPGTEQNSNQLADSELPIITVLCPLYREVAGLPGLVEAIEAIDYPSHRLDVRLVLEGDDEETFAAAMALTLPDFMRVVRVPPGAPRTKPKACNHGLWGARGDLIVVYDAEDRPSPDQLREAANAFAAAPADVVCFQARLNYYNRKQTLLTRLFSIEYALIFDLILPGLERVGAPLPLGGTSNFFRTAALVEMGGWDPFNVTEDADLGMRMAALGYQSRVLKSTTYEEATATLRPWIQQRSRWIKGYMQTWLVHCRKGPSRRSAKFFVTLHLLIATVVVAALLNPLYWIIYACWLAGAGWAEPLFPAPLGGIATFTLLAGNFFHIWLFMLAPMQRRWHDIAAFGLLAPLYWMLQSVAGVIALWELIRQPFYWSKTDHGPGRPYAEALAAAAPDGR